MDGSQIRWVVSLLLALIGGPRLWDLVLRMQNRVSWRAFSKAVRSDEVLGRIEEQKPDLIIALNDGLIPAAMLARNTEIALGYWTVELEQDSKVDTRGFEPNIAGRRVVLLDDQVYTGTGMQKALARARELPGGSGAEIIRMAVYEFESPATRRQIDWGPARRLRGRVHVMPWSFTPGHLRRYRPRNQ